MVASSLGPFYPKAEDVIYHSKYDKNVYLTFSNAPEHCSGRGGQADMFFSDFFKNRGTFLKISLLYK